MPDSATSAGARTSETRKGQKRAGKSPKDTPMVAESAAVKDYTTTVTILEAIAEAIFILNGSGSIEYANRSAQEYLQLPYDDILGRKLGAFIRSEDEETRHFLRNGLSSVSLNHPGAREIFSSSDAVMISETREIPIVITFSVIPDQQGNLQYTIVTAKEISYRKRLEQELKQRQALSVSFDRLKALGEMSVGLAHTLGQPVTAIDLRLDHIAGLDDMDEIRLQISQVKADVRRLSAIVDRVRSYAQTTAQQERAFLDVNQLLRSVLSILEYDLSAGGVRVKLALEEDIPEIEANQPELEQVFINIISNALQAFAETDSKEQHRLKVTTSAVVDKWVQVRIEDNAGGISEKVAAHIFDPFYSTRDPRQHAGTGLSTAKSILSSLGGDLSYRGVGKGTRMEMRIPINQVSERDQLMNYIELLNS